MKSTREILFCALETYALVGGLQQFNRRVIRHLDALASAGGLAPSHVVLLRDDEGLFPAFDHVSFATAGGGRFDFIRNIVRHLSSAELLLLGHVNLLPIAVIARVLRPSLPILLFVHGDEVWNQAEHRRMRFYEPWMLRAVTRIAAVSEYTARRMASAFGAPASKFMLFPNAVDTIAINSRKTEGPRKLLTVSRLGPRDKEKNVDKVLHAFSQLKAEFPDLVYEIIGDGVWRSELESLARHLGVEDRVQFRGKVDDDQLHNAYNCADIFVLPSSKEGFGIVYLEAWQRELPVICSREGASSEIIADGVDGFAVDPNDIDTLAERLRVLLLDRDAARAFGQRGRRKVEERYLDSAFNSRMRSLMTEFGLAVPEPKSGTRSEV